MEHRSVVDADVDIDVFNRDLALSGIEYVTASILRNNKLEKHNTGVYFHHTPQDLVTFFSSIPYKQAQQLGYFKIDILNVHVYEKVRDESHLLALMNTELDWNLLCYPEFTSMLIHLHNHAELVASLKPKSIQDLSIILALIRPGKQHLISKCRSEGFDSIKDEIWVHNETGFAFKKSHSIGYSMLVKVHANLILEELSL